MAANASNKSRKSRSDYNTGKNAAYRTNVASREPIHIKARINWFILGSWSVMLVMCLSFCAAIISLFM